MSDAAPEVLTDHDVGDTVRFSADELDDWIAGDVDDVRIDESYAAITVIEPFHGGRVFDLEAHHDPRVGWTTPRAFRRDYDSAPTEFVDEGELETVDAISLGIDRERILAGDTIEHVDGDRYRVIIPPVEREYDDRVLAFNLDSSSNVAEKVDPADLLANTLARPNRGGSR